MAVWVGLGQTATVAQLAGVDAGGLISMILQAVVTARENKKKCEQLARRVAMIADLLPHLQDPADVMRLPLAGLDETLREAYELVVSSQERGAAYRFVMAGRQADRFRDVQDRIDSYLNVFPIVSHIAISRHLDRMHYVQLSYHAAVQDGSAQEEEFTFREITPSSSTRANLACFDTTLGAMGGATATVCKCKCHGQLAALELVARTAAHCLRLEVEGRPAISDVVVMLERAGKLMRS